VPPDFVLGDRIAVEARRLNEHEEVSGKTRGLEVTATPLRAAVLKALRNSGPPFESRSWFVHCAVRRPLPSWKDIEKLLNMAVSEFRERLADPPPDLSVGRFIRLRFQQASQPHPTLLLLGSWSDHDAGGFLVSELVRNLQICIPEKVRKTKAFRQRYAEWWLVFEDRIGYGSLDREDIGQLRDALGPVSGFDRVVLVNPLVPTQGIQIHPGVDETA
jgi:hypothetical protein